ncbi:MAG: dihydrofolate reductase family protein [Patulibacter minatonensis]
MGPSVLLPPDRTLDDYVASLRPASISGDRPWVLANMVSAIDGAATFGGTSGAVNAYAPGDGTIFHALRGAADAVLAGATTVSAEGYGRLVPSAERRADRVARGLAPDPLAVLLSRSGEVPTDSELLNDPAQPSRIFTGAEAEPRVALRALRDEGVEVLLCEGGPSLLGALVRADVVDELFVTLSPVVGGGHPEHTLLGGEPDRPRALELRWLLELGGGLHARYAMLAAPPDPPGSLTQGALPPR